MASLEIAVCLGQNHRSKISFPQEKTPETHASFFSSFLWSSSYEFKQREAFLSKAGRVLNAVGPKVACKLL